MAKRTIAQEFEARGEARGEAKGEAKGKIEASIDFLFRLLASKPGNKKINKTFKSTVNQLNDWQKINELIDYAIKSGSVDDFIQQSKLFT
jgi:predicted transposase YdaD